MLLYKSSTLMLRGLKEQKYLPKMFTRFEIKNVLIYVLLCCAVRVAFNKGMFSFICDLRDCELRTA